MAIQYWWWLGAIALGTAEMFTGSFYLLVLAAGAGGAGLAAALGAGAAVQFVCAALISAVGAALVRRLRPRDEDDLPSQRNPNVNIDIGQTVQVEHWQENRRSRAAYRGAMWDVELLPGEPAVPGRFLIREIDGSRLRLASLAGISGLDGVQARRVGHTHEPAAEPATAAPKPISTGTPE